MYAIPSPFYSHLSIESNGPVRGNWEDVASSDGLIVKNYEELARNIAIIAYKNPRFELNFRGQSSEHYYKPEKKEKYSSIYPLIYRDLEESKMTKNEIRERFAMLKIVSKLLIDRIGIIGTKAKKFKEIQWSIIQHYKLCPTPLLDLTKSLHISASFAAQDRGQGYSYLYVFGLPRSHASISYHTDDSLVTVNLPSVCTPTALRPHFQEATFVGHFPHNRSLNIYKNLARRMLAKFRIDRTNFWNGGIARVPDSMLDPGDDEMLELLTKNLSEFSNITGQDINLRLF